MNKEAILEHLRTAKAAHINWLQRAKLLIEGLDIKEDSIPVNSTECRFGEWFYLEAQKLNGLRNNSSESMDHIEILHSKLHSTYLNIFKIYYSETERSFFAKLFSFKKKIEKEDENIARKYYAELEKISIDLLEEIHLLERRITVISQEEIDELL